MAALGLAFGLSAPGYGLWPLAWVVLIPALHWVRKHEDRKEIALGGFLFGALFHALYFLWFWDLHPLTWLGFGHLASLAVTGAGWLLLVVEGGVMLAILMLLFKWLNRFENPWIALILFPLAWVGVFYLQNLTPLTMPWALIEYTQAPVTTARVISGLLGGSGLAYGVVFHNVFWEAWLSDRLPKRETGLREGRMPAGWLLALITPALFLIGSFLPESRPAYHWPVPVAVVQGNLPIETVRSSRLLTAEVIEPTYLAPLRAADLPPDTLVVLPEEGVVPGWVQGDHPLSNPILQALSGIAHDKQVDIAVGISLLEEEQAYNAIVLLRHDVSAIQFYRKRKLVPFGEQTPFGLGAWLENTLSGFGIAYHTVFLPGGPADLLDAGTVRIGGLICFELIDSAPLHGGLAGEAKRQGADLLIDVSNLGWFHENRLLEAQFLAIARMRAAENHLPLILSSNTGVSAILSPTGRILARSDRSAIKSGRPQVVFFDGRRPF